MESVTMILSDTEWIQLIRRLTADQQRALLNLLETVTPPASTDLTAIDVLTLEQYRSLSRLFDEQASQEIRQALQDLEQIDLEQWA
jgi:hypothetical protein